MKHPTKRTPRRRIFVALSVVLALTCAAGAQHVIVISCDGLRPDAVAELGEKGAPNFHRLITEGAFTHNARTDVDYTVTLPNHTCMISGRGVKGAAGHAWTSNSNPKLGQNLHRNKKAYVGGMFDVAHDHGLRTGLFVSKDKFVLYDISYNDRNGQPDAVGEDNGNDKIDKFVFEEDIGILIGRFLAEMEHAPFHLSMIHLRATDTSGHAKGWDLTEGSEYMKALQQEDAYIGRLLRAIDEDERLKGKASLIVTTDHGGRLETKTHIDSTHHLNYTIPFYVWGPGVAEGAELYEMNPETRAAPGKTVNPGYGAEGLPPIRNGDAGNLALGLLGLPAIQGSTINAKHDLRVAKPASAEPPAAAGEATGPSE